MKEEKESVRGMYKVGNDKIVIIVNTYGFVCRVIFFENFDLKFGSAPFLEIMISMITLKFV